MNVVVGRFLKNPLLEVAAHKSYNGLTGQTIRLEYFIFEPTLANCHFDYNKNRRFCWEY